jgi:hypothetical protein
MFQQEVSYKQSNNASSQLILVPMAMNWRMHCELRHKEKQNTPTANLTHNHERGNPQSMSSLFFEGWPTRWQT